MSKTYELVCFEDEASVWVGQGNEYYFSFYSDDGETMFELEKFLKSHIGKPLYLLDTETAADMFAMPSHQIKEILEGMLKL